MNGKVSLGQTQEGKDYIIDFVGDNVCLTVLTGTTGSGKSILHYHMYRTLMDQNKPTELGFVFMDMTRTDFTYWRNTHLYCPVIVDREEAFLMLERLGDLSRRRADGEADASRAIFVHIEECDMIALDKSRFESALQAITNHKEKNNIYVVFSSSRPSLNFFTDKIQGMTDMRVVYHLASSQDYMNVTGQDLSSEFIRLDGPAGKHAVIIKGGIEFLEPFSETYAQEIKREEDALLSEQSPYAK